MYALDQRVSADRGRGGCAAARARSRWARCRRWTCAVAVTPAHQKLLRRLAMSDESATLGAVIANSDLVGLDRKTCTLTRVAALIAIESRVSSYQWAIDSAIACGATEEEIVDVLLAVAPVVGLARVTAAAPELALALGYDVEEASE